MFFSKRYLNKSFLVYSHKLPNFKCTKPFSYMPHLIKLLLKTTKKL